MTSLRQHRLAVGTLALALVACSPKPVGRVIAIAPAQEPAGARYLHRGPVEIAAQLRLPGGDILSVGKRGRRMIHGPSGALREAYGLVADLDGVMRTAKGQFAFVDAFGTVAIAESPLGPIIERHAPLEAGSATTGRDAILVESHETWRRSIDAGRTWKPLTIALDPYHIVSAAISTDGTGLAAAVPQRLFVTRDDGATWNPIASPGIGLRSVRVGPDGRVLLHGSEGRVAAFVAGESRFERLEAPPAFPFPKQLDVSRTPLLLGEHAGFLYQDVESGFDLVIEEGAFGEAPRTHRVVKRDECSYTEIAAFDAHVALLCPQVGKMILRESFDRGATWAKPIEIDGGAQSFGQRIAVGPNGWLWVTPTYDPQRKARVRIGQALVETTFPEPLDGVVKIVATNDRVWALGHTTTKRLRLFDAPLDSATFKDSGLVDVDDAGWIAAHVISIDAEGTLRVAVKYSAGWILRERRRDGSTLAPRYLPVRIKELSLAGRRGFALTSDWGTNLETADGGATFFRVEAPSALRTVECATSGCLFEDTIRIGWDLPALSEKPELIAASAELTAPGPRVDSTLPAEVPTLDCKVEGPWVELPRASPRERVFDPAIVDVGAHGLVGFTEVDENQRAIAKIVTPNKIDTVELLPAY